MATEVVRDLADTIIGNKDTVEAMELDLESNPSAATIILVDNTRLAGYEELNTEEPSGYTLTCESGYSRDVERWMRGDSPARAPLSAPLSAPSGDSALLRPPQQITPTAGCGLRYITTTALASLCTSVRPDWISSILFSKLEGAVAQAGCLCSHLQGQVRRLTEEQALREVFAAAMDVVLVAYAIGFLLLSLCQASLVGF